MNESQDRDQTVERLLRQSLQRPDDGATDACLDAETLAAWIDGGLSASARESAQAHVAGCARCQSLVGTVVRLDTAFPQPERAPRRHWLAWLVPISAAAAVVAVWIAVPREADTPRSIAPVEQGRVADAKASEPAAQEKRSEAQALAKEELKAKKNEASQKQAPPRDRREDAAQPGNAQMKALSADEAIRTTTAAAPSVPAAAQKAAGETAQSKTLGALADKPPFKLRELPESSTGPTVVLRESSAPTDRAELDASRRLQDRLWRLSGPIVEHSSDGGTTWNVAFTGPVALTAVAAPSASVCWVVGRGGVVLLSTDGRSFSRVPFPEATDLSAVRATDARSALVSTLDGRTFATADGGATWTLRPPQEF